MPEKDDSTPGVPVPNQASVIIDAISAAIRDLMALKGVETISLVERGRINAMSAVLRETGSAMCRIPDQYLAEAGFIPSKHR